MDQILQTFKSLSSKFPVKKVSYERHKIRPTRDWRILIISTFIFLCIFAGVAFYIYIQIDQGKLFVMTDDSVGTETKINQNLFKKTIEKIDSREALLLETEQGKVVPADPSM